MLHEVAKIVLLRSLLSIFMTGIVNRRGRRNLGRSELFHRHTSKHGRWEERTVKVNTKSSAADTRGDHEAQVEVERSWCRDKDRSQRARTNPRTPASPLRLANASGLTLYPPGVLAQAGAPRAAVLASFRPAVLLPWVPGVTLRNGTTSRRPEVTSRAASWFRGRWWENRLNARKGPQATSRGILYAQQPRECFREIHEEHIVVSVYVQLSSKRVLTVCTSHTDVARASFLHLTPSSNTGAEPHGFVRISNCS